ncbi:hypothetical protein [Halobacterium salinarum]|uniref:hypothetical protein n=1 Tax=Halobacterium salinarum TaxID=2242 RepID=UPI001F3AD97E|nr:hypothetical protein [Halobacterium salinarum]MCF2166054.1 hypothetical protein [Halobacterium salinarum]MCF2166656.1 hypothetical protein [Halobacterium salinarum]
MSNPDGQSTDVSELSPEQRLEPQNTRLINAGIVTINNMETLRACVAYENANQQRVQILRRLEQRASELRAQDD